MNSDLVDEVYRLFNEVLLSQPSEIQKELWEEHLRIRTTLAKVSAVQTTFAQPTDREASLKPFLEWCEKAGVNLSQVQVKRDKYGGFCLVTKTNVEVPNEPVLIAKTPRSAILTPDGGRINKGLRDIFISDAVVGSVDNVAVVLLLIHERLDPKSQWKPYIDFLPANCTTTLTMTVDELQSMKPSPTFLKALLFYRCIARHYTHFLLLLTSKHMRATSRSLVDAMRKTNMTAANFTFEMYCWATSIVTTRVNRIPNNIQPTAQTAYSPALIPLLELCNAGVTAEEETCNIEYSASERQAELLAIRTLRAGAELLVPLGDKPNHSCIIYSGYVPSKPNMVNYYDLALGFPRNSPQWKYTLTNDSRGNSALAFHAEVKDWMLNVSYITISPLWVFARTFTAKDVDDLDSEENARRAAAFLATRFELLVSSYKNLPETEPEEGQGSLVARYIWRMLNTERFILKAAAEFFKSAGEALVASRMSLRDRVYALEQHSACESGCVH